jgi:hypothetical protein
LGPYFLIALYLKQRFGELNLPSSSGRKPTELGQIDYIFSDAENIVKLVGWLVGWFIPVAPTCSIGHP